MHQHGISMAHHQLLLLSIGLAENCQIGENHDGAGYPERYRARYDGVVLVHHKRAHLRILPDVNLMLPSGIPAHEDGQKREKRRRYPDVNQHNANHTFSHTNRILEWLNNRIVSAKRVKLKRSRSFITISSVRNSEMKMLRVSESQ